jgi:L-asparaginase / beta-aspartyl-peptidase
MNSGLRNNLSMNMKIWHVMVVLLYVVLSPLFSNGQNVERPSYVLVIHGGAGNIPEASLNEDALQAYQTTLQEALNAGESILKSGGTSLDAVETAVKILEDSPLFNAGRGAVFTMEGTNELDAAIMCGNSLDAGAVAGITTLKNPISAARKIMDHSPHVMLIGKGAEQFGYEQGVEVVPPSYFFDQRRWDQYREHIRRQQQLRGSVDPAYYMGTVGAVALDKQGNLAAATSTGGMTGKSYGRVGDVPIIGAGTYANNASCAVSATGHGELFIRHVVAHTVSAMMIYGNVTLDFAATDVIQQLKEIDGNGGLIAVDKEGNISMPFNTASMFRGYTTSNGDQFIGIFAD